MGIYSVLLSEISEAYEHPKLSSETQATEREVDDHMSVGAATEKLQ
jgi:hypothetical protein